MGSANYGALTLIHILYLALFWSFYSMPMMKECSICQYFPSTWDKLPVIAPLVLFPLPIQAATGARIGIRLSLLVID